MNVLQELNRIDWKNNPGAASVPARVLLGILIFAVIGAIAYFVFIEPKLTEREGLVQQEASKLEEFKTKQRKAASLEPLKKQLADIELMLEQRIKQLPNKTQMAELLVDISQQALAAGIQTDKFEPQGEISKEFYAEKPISLKMVGTYHQFGQFISGVANLPRVVILTMHDISLTPNDKTGAGGAKLPPGVLVLEGTVKTYRYLETDEAVAPPGAPPPPGAGPAAGAAR